MLCKTYGPFPMLRPLLNLFLAVLLEVYNGREIPAEARSIGFNQVSECVALMNTSGDEELVPAQGWRRDELRAARSYAMYAEKRRACRKRSGSVPPFALTARA